MDVEKHISETAFITSESRARKVEVSRDVYAKFWVTPKTKKIWKDFAKAVYPHDDLKTSIRNRYFLEHLEFFIQSQKNPVFINIAAGFSSYPFLIKSPCRCIELDYQHVIDFKSKKIAQWQKEKLFPDRDVKFFPADLEQEGDLKKLEKVLKSEGTNRPSFILLEGLSYYLEMKLLKRLLKMLGNIQNKESVLGFDFWTPDVEHHPIFFKLEKYFRDRFGYKERTYNFFDRDFILKIDGYKVFELTDPAAQERKFLGTQVMEGYNDILPSSYVILRRT